MRLTLLVPMAIGVLIGAGAVILKTWSDFTHFDWGMYE